LELLRRLPERRGDDVGAQDVVLERFADGGLGILKRRDQVIGADSVSPG
jgi:hypothetical protein